MKKKANLKISRLKSTPTVLCPKLADFQSRWTKLTETWRSKPLFFAQGIICLFSNGKNHHHYFDTSQSIYFRKKRFLVCKKVYTTVGGVSIAPVTNGNTLCKRAERR